MGLFIDPCKSDMDKMLAESLGYMYHQKQISFELMPHSKNPSGLVHKYYSALPI